jgi:UDP-3-O-acyl-N-acetylglucosamine deacetylase
LTGLQIDNCLVVVNAEEMPGCDGSASAFVAALDAAGLVQQDAPVVQLIVDRPLRLGSDKCWIEARPPKREGLSVEFVLDYGPETPIGRQKFSIDVSPDSFRRSLASCRTFLLEDEARLLNAQGLGRRVTPRDLLIFGPDGPVGNSLRFPDECARHKVLDVVGDLALAGCEIFGQIVAYRSGHQRNAQLVQAMLDTFPPVVPLMECA